MKVSLTLTRVEMRGLLAAVGSCQRASFGGEDAGSIAACDLLGKLWVKLVQRVATAKAKGNRVTLNDGEVIAVWYTLNEIVRRLPALEQAVGLDVLKEIEREGRDHARLMKANFGWPEAELGRR